MFLGKILSLDLEGTYAFYIYRHTSALTDGNQSSKVLIYNYNNFIHIFRDYSFLPND